jgi:hypothetical protein
MSLICLFQPTIDSFDPETYRDETENNLRSIEEVGFHFTDARLHARGYDDRPSLIRIA